MKTKIMRLVGWMGARTGEVAFYAAQVTMAVVYFTALCIAVGVVIIFASLYVLYEILAATAGGLGKVMIRCRKWITSKRLKPAVEPS